MFVLMLASLAFAVTAALTSTGGVTTIVFAILATIVAIECMVFYWRSSPDHDR